MQKQLEQTKKELQKLEIPSLCFKYRTVDEQMGAEQTQYTPVSKFEWNKGIFLYLVGAEYPQKTMTSPETLWAVNVAKRNFIEPLRLLSNWYFFPTFLVISLLPWKKKVQIVERFLESYCQMSWKPITPFILKSDFLTPVAREIEWFVYTLLDNMGIKKDLCDKVSEIFAAMIEYDSFYRYFLEDTFSETTKTALVANPRKEILRLLEVVKSRSYYLYDTDPEFTPRVVFNKFVFPKLKMVGYLLSLLMFFRGFRGAFKLAISEIDVRKMGLDEADTYWVCFRKDYQFLGKTYEERQEMIKNKSVPLLVDGIPPVV